MTTHSGRSEPRSGGQRSGGQRSGGQRSGGQVLVDCLTAQDVRRVFCVPGESYLAVLDALYDAPIETIVCRQEGGAAMMADAEGRLTNRPGIAFVTRGPGATNASAGVHIAFQDSTPMILFVGQVARDMSEREAFQEIDYRRMFGQMAKWVAQIDDAARIPEFVSRAFHTAMAGRPGPVVLALPEDMLCDRVEAPAIAKVDVGRAFPDSADVTRLRAMLEEAQRPLVMLGGGGWDARAAADMQSFAQSWDLPVAVSFRCQDYFDNTHPCYAGDVAIGVNPKLAARLKDADVLLVIGAKLGEMTTGGYRHVEIPVPRQHLVHVLAGPEEVGRVYQPALGINAHPGAMAEVLRGLNAPSDRPWSGAREQARADYLAWTEPPAIPGAVQMGEIMSFLRERLGADAIIANGAGNYAGWPNRFYRYCRPKTLLGPTSGSMGYGTPAAVAAKLAHPQREVVAFAGDGCFMMNGQEFATAVQYGAAIIVILVNNGMYGTIRMHQEREYPGRISATTLRNPQFADLARAYGGHGELVERTEEFAPAFERAVASGQPALIEIRIDPEAITPNTTLSAIRAAAQGS